MEEGVGKICNLTKNMADLVINSTMIMHEKIVFNSR